MTRKTVAPAQLKLRLSEDLKRQLEDQAQSTGNSLNREIVRRLENSLQAQPSYTSHHRLELPNAHPSQKTAAAVAALVTRHIEAFTQERWTADRFTAEAVVEAFRLYVLSLTSLGEPKLPEMISARPKDRFTEDFENPDKLAYLAVGPTATKIASRERDLNIKQIEAVVEGGLDLPRIIEILEERKFAGSDDA